MSYVWAGYAATAGVVAAYAVRMLRRGRQLARQVPTEGRRWT